VLSEILRELVVIPSLKLEEPDILPLPKSVSGNHGP
jgi:hypothetical protein